MTALLWAKDHFQSVLLEKKFPSIKLMYDEENPTNEEEILNEDLEEIFIKLGSSMAEIVEI
jgi:hypothetical protein